MGFRTTSFDDWGRNQFERLTTSEKQWLQENPEFATKMIHGQHCQDVIVNMARFDFRGW